MKVKLNIFQKIALANEIIKLINDLKNFFDNNTVAEAVKNQVERLITDFKELGNLAPQVKNQVNRLADIIKGFFGKKK